MLAEAGHAHGVEVEAVLESSRGQRITRERAAFYVQATAEAGQTLAGLTGRTQAAVWQAMLRHRDRGKAGE